MAQVPPSDIFTRRVCLQLDGMDAVTYGGTSLTARPTVIFASTSTTHQAKRTMVAGPR